MTRAEHDHLRSLAPLFVQNGQGPVFIQAVGWTLHYDWPALQALIDGVLDDIPHKQVSLTVKPLVDAVYWAVHESYPAPLPQGLGTWLLDQLLRMPDLNSLDDRTSWRVEEILKRVGRAPLSWLPKALARRRDMEAQGDDAKVWAVSRHTRLSRYVTQISAAHVSDPDVRKAVEALVDFVSDHGTVGHYLPEILQDVDPEGLLIPAEATRRLTHVTSEEDVRPLARIAGVYAMGSSAWRTIAKPVINRDNIRKTTAAALFESVRQAFGWPIGISYAIRNHFVHNGAQIGGSDFFEGPSAASAFRISTDGWDRVEKTAESDYRVERSCHRAGASWPSTPRDDLRVVLTVCEREMDDALGVLLGSACGSLRAHVAFMVGED